MKPASLCPICSRAAVKEFVPFCSKRCADIDLGRWFRGSYSAPAVEDDEISDDEENQQH